MPAFVTPKEPRPSFSAALLDTIPSTLPTFDLPLSSSPPADPDPDPDPDPDSSAPIRSLSRDAAEPDPEPESEEPIPRSIHAQGVTFAVLSPEELPLNIPTFGDDVASRRRRGRVSRAATAGTKRAVEEAAAAQGKDEDEEVKWEKRRRLTIEQKLFSRTTDKLEEAEIITTEDGYTLSRLPEWLNAVRESQDDGKPGVFLIRPKKRDFEQRFEEILEALEGYGTVFGAVKIKVPDECLDPPVPYEGSYPQQSPSSADSPPLLDPVDVISQDFPSSGQETSRPRGRPRKQRTHDRNGRPLVYEMDQTLPLHKASTSSLTPIYKVLSTTKDLVSPAPYLDLISAARSSNPPNYRLIEETMLLRGRTWESIISGSKGGLTSYSSDNDATPSLRSLLNIGNPKLTALPGNIIHESSAKVTGIHTPYLYIGQAYTIFALHAEDYSALSLNYHHLGADKCWSICSPLDFNLVEDFIQGIEGIPRDSRKCSQFVRHASVYVPGVTWDVVGVRHMQFRQRQGEMVVTWPLGYHQGWNEGGNVNEAVGYGNRGWRGLFDVADGGGGSGSGSNSEATVDATEAKKAEEMVYRPCGVKCAGGAVGMMPVRLCFEDTA